MSKIFDWFEGQVDPYPSEEPTRPPKTLYAFCRHYTKGMEVWLVGLAIVSALIAATEVLLFGFLGNVVNWLSESDPKTFIADEWPSLLFMGLVILVAKPLISSVGSLIMHQALLGNFPMRIRWDVHGYLIRQSMTYFQDEFAGRIATKLMQTALAVRETVMKILDILVYVVTYFVGILVVTLAADWRLMIPFVIWLIAYISLMRYFVPRMRKISAEQADARSLMTGRIVDSYTNIATVKLFSHSNREEAYAKESMDGFLQTVYRQMRLGSTLDITIVCMNSILLFSVAWIGISLWIGGQISPGPVAVALGIILRIWGMSYWVMWEMSALFENIGTVQDGINSISLPRLVADNKDAKPIPKVKGNIEFNDVTFNYGSDKGIIEGLNLNIPAGQKVGLVGRSGAGKSTLVNIILRFYDVEKGTISIDGRDISKVTQDSLRENLAMVTQDTSLLHRSVRENLLYGRPDATEEMMIAAARQAEAHDFILELTDPKGRQGYNAHVGERGVKLSGGQRQRVAIARVLLKDAPILILDEATSALDSEVEAAIQSQLQHLMQGKTVIAIAHRLSTIAEMDRLIVMDQGKIIEDGSHDELIAQNGVYAQLWKRQSGGFINPVEEEELIA
ncbi:ABC transporter ATP-binding protein [uncultured Maritalea sp.]|jgi:ATP-binding cassette subfamily B multidrug efflux pump|uniref:ABC transporter ATP-binding protein n=1 Tax=uncultured Maritalea sp. TaxID=757249 RepID=UPI00262E84F1|nr:ABC transporter ATP-binding protein [uncultured Maritalea sp.]